MGFLQHNWVWKLISLLIAFSLYLWVQREEATNQREFTVLLDLPVPTGQVLVDPPTPVPVRVSIEGPAEELESIHERDVRPTVHMEGYRPGQTAHLPIDVERTAALARDDLRVRCFPPTIAIRTEVRIERRVQLSIDTEGALPEGWDWSEAPKADSDQVLVSGLKPTVDRVDRVVATVRTLAPQEQVVAPATLRAVDRAGEEVLDHVTLDPSQVLVRARLTRTVWSKRVYVQPIFSVPPGPRLRVTVDPKRVTIYGTARALQELHFIETPELDVPAGQTRYEQEVHLDGGSGIVRIDPPTARITVEQLAATEGR